MKKLALRLLLITFLLSGCKGNTIPPAIPRDSEMEAEIEKIL